jgi:hypothetical protein
MHVPRAHRRLPTRSAEVVKNRSGLVGQPLLQRGIHPSTSRRFVEKSLLLGLF